MRKIVDYAKTHKLIVFLSLVVCYFLFKGSIVRPLTVSNYGVTDYGSPAKSLSVESIMPSMGISDMAYESAPAPITDTPDRKVVLNSNFSLLVKDVTESIDQIKAKVAQVSGFVIDVSIYRGESSESANLTLRIPSDSVDEVTKYLKSVSVKVVSENVSGKDITDKYVDVETRISELYKVKAKLENIMDNAITSDEMLRVFRQINDINTQIDSYKGQLTYMDKTSSTSKLTVALSTDELSLPYSPAQPWRPEVIFKSAVRSMLGTLQSLGTLIIWLGVYLPIIGLAIVSYVVAKRWLIRKKPDQRTQN